ncbi:MAG: glycosyltransferase family 2 protein [Alphaproteobacteria bacterium]
MSDLSVLIIIKDEEKQIERCLQSVSFADEIVVILDKCKDGSKKIVKKFTKNHFSGNWKLEGERRNYGIKKCTKKWILEVDADERVPDELKTEIINIINSSKSDWHKIRVNNFLGKDIINFGWGAYFGKSAYAGLFKKGMKIWGNERVHPKIVLLGSEGNTLRNRLNHFYCKNIEDLFIKLDSYSSARALDLYNSDHKETLVKNVKRIFSRFWKCFFLRKGYREKDVGFVIALVASIYPLISYLKYVSLKND